MNRMNEICKKPIAILIIMMFMLSMAVALPANAVVTDLTPPYAKKGATVPILSFNIVAPTGGTTLYSLTIEYSGTSIDDISYAAVYVDEKLFGTVSKAFFTGNEATMSGEGDIASGAPGLVELRFKLATGATEGNTVDGRITDYLLSVEGDLGTDTLPIDPAGFTIIDRTNPTITDETPTGETVIQKPTISAVLADTTSGINEINIVMTVDSLPVIPTIPYNPLTGVVSYTPSSDLLIGEHTVEITVYDLAGNKATAEWAFTVVPPAESEVTEVKVSAVPSSDVPADGTTKSIITATVKDQYGLPMASETVVFTTTLGELSAASGVTGTGGTVSVELTSIETGKATVTASAGSEQDEVKVKFIDLSDISDILSLLENDDYGLFEIKKEIKEILEELDGTYGLSAIKEAIDTAKADIIAAMPDLDLSSVLAKIDTAKADIIAAMPEFDLTPALAAITDAKDAILTDIGSKLTPGRLNNIDQIDDLKTLIEDLDVSGGIASKQENDRTTTATTPYVIGGLTPNKVFEGTMTLQLDTTLESKKTLSVEVWDGDSWVNVWTSSSKASAGTSVSLNLVGKTTTTGYAVRIVTTSTSSKTFDYVFAYQIDMR